MYVQLRSTIQLKKVYGISARRRPEEISHVEHMIEETNSRTPPHIIPLPICQSRDQTFGIINVSTLQFLKKKYEKMWKNEIVIGTKLIWYRTEQRENWNDSGPAVGGYPIFVRGSRGRGQADGGGVSAQCFSRAQIVDRLHKAAEKSFVCFFLHINTPPPPPTPKHCSWPGWAG